MKCVWCEKELSKKQEKENRRFCSTSCSAKWRTSNFDYHKKKTPEGLKSLSDSLKERWKTSSFRENNRIRMTEDNPSRLPDYRDKVVKTMIERGGYKNNFIAGNGKISKIEQIIYGEMISRGFVYNYAIPTREAIKEFPNKKYATNYKPDFTLISKKICIEIDGEDHDKRIDDKKDECLSYLGFLVFRFSNKQVNENPKQILKEVDRIVREANRQ